MVLPFRKTLFWIHLVVGIVVGLVVAIMSVTGVAIAFESQVLSWAESEARSVPAPEAGARRLPVETLLAKVREAKPEAQVSGVTVYPSPTASVLVALGRNALVYVNPYTGEVKEGGAQGLRDFFRVMVEWHRWISLGGDSRPVGKAITGACNVGFLFLALSGLYLWWPRKWTVKTVRPVLWFRGGLKGKARDFNWHNVIGFWSMSVLVVVTASAMVISYRWASDFAYTVTGNPAPANNPSPSVKVPQPPQGSERMALGGLFEVVQTQVPAWASITYRVPAPPPRGGGAAQPQDAGGVKGSAKDAPAPGGSPGESAPGAAPGVAPRESAPAPGAAARESGASAPPGASPQEEGVDAIAFSVKEQDGWPLFASTQVSVDPFAGTVARREGFADFNRGRRLRTWLRFLHTGEALGWPGQLIAAIASLGGVFLVWTGFALSWRRFFPRRQA